MWVCVFVCVGGWLRLGLGLGGAAARSDRSNQSRNQLADKVIFGWNSF